MCDLNSRSIQIARGGVTLGRLRRPPFKNDECWPAQPGPTRFDLLAGCMMSMNQPPDSKPTRRRWLRFSIRGLLLLTGVIAAGLGWHMQRVNTQRDAMEKLQALEVHLVLKDAAGQRLDDGGATSWLREWLGPHHFGAPDSAALPYLGTEGEFSPIVDQLVRLPSVKSLSIWADPMDVDAYRQIARLEQVETIYIHTHSSVTGRRVEPLTTMPNLRSLEFQESMMERSAFEMIAKIATLKTLYVPSLGDETRDRLAKQRPDLAAHHTGNYAP